MLMYNEKEKNNFLSMFKEFENSQVQHVISMHGRNIYPFNLKKFKKINLNKILTDLNHD